MICERLQPAFSIATMNQTKLATGILYLDFDGVLHDGEVYFHPERGVFIATPGRTLFEWMSVLDGLIQPHPEVKIVLSTSWVASFGFEFAKAQLSQTLQQRVIGATIDFEERSIAEFVHRSRGQQIANDVQHRQTASWFAIDDDETDWPTDCRNNLIRTESCLGISSPVIQVAVRAKLAFG
jgi:hypothetical protein